MTIITRRAALGGLALLPATAAAGTPSRAIDTLRLPDATLTAGRAAHDAEERVLHHLLAAGNAMDELVADDDCRWFVSLGGKAPFQNRFIYARRIRLMPDPEHPEVSIERFSDVIRWQV